MKTISFVILAAGKGVRMKSSVPKPLLRVGNKTMLRRVIESAKELNPEKLVVVVSSKKVEDKIKDLDIDTAWQKKPVGTADALGVALFKCADNGDVILSCSDIPLVTGKIFNDLYEKHKRNNNYITILTSEVPEPKGYGRVIKKKNEVVKIVEEKELREEERKIKLINSGIYCMERKNLEKYLKRIKKSAVKGEYYLTDLIAIVIKEGLKVGEFMCDYKNIQGINTKAQLKEVWETLKNV